MKNNVEHCCIAIPNCWNEDHFFQSFQLGFKMCTGNAETPKNVHAGTIFFITNVRVGRASFNELYYLYGYVAVIILFSLAGPPLGLFFLRNFLETPMFKLHKH